jgi:hypothetical protein
MDDTDRLVAAIFAATIAFKRNIIKSEEILAHYDHFLRDLQARTEKTRPPSSATAPAPAADPPAGASAQE